MAFRDLGHGIAAVGEVDELSDETTEEVVEAFRIAADGLFCGFAVLTSDAEESAPDSSCGPQQAIEDSATSPAGRFGAGSGDARAVEAEVGELF